MRPDVVDAINALNLPRYGLGNYVAATPHKPPTPAEAKQLQDLSRAGKRLMGFCRTNLFKRLESSGQAFQQSIERHVLRNYVFLHAIENELATADRHAGCRAARHRATTTRMSTTSDDAELFDDDEDDERTPAPQARSCATEDDFKRARRRDLRALRHSVSSAGSSGCARTCSSSPLQKDLADDAASLLEILTAMRRLGSATRTPSSTRCIKLLDQETPEREGPRLHPVRRHRSLPRARS